jgi:hypothetical protein
MHHGRSDYDFDVISGPSTRLPAPPSGPLPAAGRPRPPQAEAPAAAPRPAEQPENVGKA